MSACNRVTSMEQHCIDPETPYPLERNAWKLLRCRAGPSTNVNFWTLCGETPVLIAEQVTSRCWSCAQAVNLIVLRNPRESKA
jgi:hypothetical protein